MTAVQTAPTSAGARSSSPVKVRRPRRRFSPLTAVALVILVVMAVAWLIPFFWALITSLKTETDAAASPITLWPTGGITFEAYTMVLRDGNIPLWAWNSLFTSAAITALTLITSALAGYAFARIDFTGRKWLFAVVIGSIIIPGQILLVPLFHQMLAFKMVDSYAGIILPQIIHPAMVFILKRFFEQIPIELEEAARVDGASRLRVFFQIVLPLSRPILAAVSIFTFIGAWNNFLWPFIVVNDSALMTLPVGLQTVKSAYGIQYAQNMASAILAALPLIIVFLFFQKQIIKGVATTGFGGQ